MSIRWSCPLLLAAWLANPQTPPDQVVIQAGTHVVTVNVVVKDKHEKPVDDLSREDFILQDNGQPQKIAFFALERAETAASVSTPLPLTFTNRPGPSSTAATVFLFDELNTQLTDQELAKKDFLRYLRKLPADSRVAVFVLGDSLSMLHDFSQDMASLLAAIGKHSSRVNPEVQAVTEPAASANSLTGDQTTTSQWNNFLRSSNQPYVDYTETVRATRTAAALRIIAGHLQGIPGRKTLIWISGGFPIQLGLRNRVDSTPQSDSGSRSRNRSDSEKGASTSRVKTQPSSTTPNTSLTLDLPGSGLSFENDVERAVQALNESDVAVYPVDARGVMVAPAFQADRNSMGKRSKPSKSAFSPNYNYETLETLAEQTGGRAFHNINDLSIAIEQAQSDTKVSYALAFVPAAAALDGSYHRLEVTVKRPGVKLRYRPGYVAARDTAVAPPLAEAIANPVALAGIGFTVHLEPVEGGYKASMTIDARNITLEPKDGKWSGALQFLVLVGKVEQLTTIPLSFTDATLHQIQDRGLVMGARVKTPPGTTGFSVGFRDIPSGIVGTLHVPL